MPAGAPRVGRVVALDHPHDCPRQLTVSPIGEMRLQEIGNRSVSTPSMLGVADPHGLVVASLMVRQLRLVPTADSRAARSCGLGRSGLMAQNHCVSQTRTDLVTGGEASWCTMSTSSACAGESEKTTEVTAVLFQNRALGPQDQIEAYE
jgi:hypothetical protein